MSKIYPNCQEVFDDNHGFCSNCGSMLHQLDSILSLKDMKLRMRIKNKELL